MRIADARIAILVHFEDSHATSSDLEKLAMRGALSTLRTIAAVKNRFPIEG